MNTPPRPTPETNAVAWVVAFGYQHLNEDIEVVDAECARQLERERDEAREQLEAMREAIKEVSLQLTFAEKVSRTSVLHIYVYDALAKLKPFIKP